MEGLSIAANSLAVVSITFQLTEACIKLYRFWESVEDAPQEIAAVKEDLQYLISIFRRIESTNSIGDGIAEGIQHCRIKVLELTTIVENFETGFQSLSRRKRKWTSFKAATQSKNIQRFRESLSETKSTLTLALVHQCVIQSQSQTSAISTGTTVFENSQCRSIVVRVDPSTLFEQWVEDGSVVRHKLIIPPVYREQDSLRRLPVSTNEVAKKVLTNFEQSVSKRATASLEIKELMLHAIRQTAVVTLKPDSFEILAQDGYTMNDTGAIQSRTFVYSENLRYRVRHHA